FNERSSVCGPPVWGRRQLEVFQAVVVLVDPFRERSKRPLAHHVFQACTLFLPLLVHGARLLIATRRKAKYALRKEFGAVDRNDDLLQCDPLGRFRQGYTTIGTPE